MKPLEYIDQNYNVFSSRGLPRCHVDIRLWGDEIGELSFRAAPIESLWRLIAIVMPHCKEFAYEIKKKDSDVPIYGICKGDNFFLFTTECEPGNLLLQYPNKVEREVIDNSDLVGVYDGCWELAYFVPTACSLTFRVTVRMVMDMLLNEDFADGILFFMGGEKVFKAYKSLAIRYGLDY